jgi:hypothetical protein
VHVGPRVRACGCAQDSGLFLVRGLECPCRTRWRQLNDVKSPEIMNIILIKKNVLS